MSTNQTIDGVPRVLLENFASYAEGSASGEVQLWVQKLRDLLDGPKCSACNDTGRMHEPGSEPGACSACFEQPATHPDVELVAVEYQYRQRPLWRKDDNSGWMPWMDCSPEVHANYTASPELHYWQYETRTLYAGPNQL